MNITKKADCAARRLRRTPKNSFFPRVAAGTLGGFDFQELVSVVHVACGLNLVLAKTTEGIESFDVFALLHVPDAS
jgi:hypothetical protein